MERQHFMVSAHHMRWLRKVSKEREISMSEILRKALDEYIAKEGK